MNTTTIYSLHLHDDIVFLGTDIGIYRSFNRGEDWNHSKTEELEDEDIKCITSNKSTVFATGSMGILGSKDNGNTWEKLDSGIKDVLIYDLKCYNENLIANAHGKIYFSINNGAIWDTLPTQGIPDRLIQSMAIDKNRIYIGTYDHGLFATDNYGETWNNITKDVINHEIRSINTNGDYIYLGTSEGIYRSTDNGLSWNKSDKDVQWSNSKVVNCIYIVNEKLYMGTGSGVFVSENKGESWKALNNGLFKNDSINEYHTKQSWFNFLLFVVWALFWITPLFLLSKVKKGLRIYFLNLIVSLVFIFGGWAVLSNYSSGSGLGNLGLAIMLFFVYGVWGIVFFFYSIFKRWRHKRDNFHGFDPPTQ